MCIIETSLWRNLHLISIVEDHNTINPLRVMMMMVMTMSTTTGFLRRGRKWWCCSLPHSFSNIIVSPSVNIIQLNDQNLFPKSKQQSCLYVLAYFRTIHIHSFVYKFLNLSNDDDNSDSCRTNIITSPPIYNPNSQSSICFCPSSKSTAKPVCLSVLPSVHPSVVYLFVPKMILPRNVKVRKT